MRPKLCEVLPRQGVPPVFATLEDLAAFLAWGRRSASFPDASHLWYEVRLHPLHGTVEVRVPDVQTRLEDAAAVAAVAHSLVVALAERHAAGEVLAVHATARIQENRWRALRHGVHGHLVDLTSGATSPTRDVLRGLLDELEPVAARLGATAPLQHARSLLAGTGANRQRTVHARSGLTGLMAWLADETEAAGRF